MHSDIRYTFPGQGAQDEIGMREIYALEKYGKLGSVKKMPKPCVYWKVKHLLLWSESWFSYVYIGSSGLEVIVLLNPNCLLPMSMS